ncbi:MAG TPA: 16S rRNA (cytosine(1402)-N(4))-methyltransferase [Candidatus Pacebacteria bacterium]|nr:16S rRNA (cytosine(1402)-N(4))-methyltransferase [Candidatus Paceibacterota bacterium]
MIDSHFSVLKNEVLDWLKPQAEAWYLDGTFGRGGHTAAILKTGAKVIALDFDQKAISAGMVKFKAEIAQKQLCLIRENFTQLDQVLRQLAQTQLPDLKLSGAVFDFGTSIEQLKYDNRGLSFDQPDQPLDMRLDDRLGVTAADLLLALPEKHLAQLFSEYGGEHQARSLAKAIVFERQKHPEKLKTVGDFLSITAKVLPPRHGHLNPATKAFQALRIAVNDELTNIQVALPKVLPWLKSGARLVTIAFHEGEDRLVKDWFLEWEAAQFGNILTQKPVIASESELSLNSRSRSAKLRVFSKN